MWTKQRPRSKFFSYLVTDHSGTIESFYRAGTTGLSSTQKNRVFSGLKVHSQKVHSQALKVPTITLTKLLDESGVKKVDFLSMDIEDSEPAALAGFDIDRFHPDLVCIETSRKVGHKILLYFEEHGYERIEEYLRYDKSNWYFTRKAKP